jgi:hypothetical protein
MAIDLIDRASFELAKTRHRVAKRRKSGAPIVVFAMAKTGTTAVAAALRSAGFGPVFQVHDLDPEFLNREEREYRWSGRPWRNWDAQSVLRRPATTAAPWRVISLVREPIAQSVSAFFQPSVRRGYVDSATATDQLLERFGDRLDRLPLRWFESHLQPALGIDVYDNDFDVDRGYAIVATPTVKLLVLRCEGLDVAPHALAELLDADRPIDVGRENVGSDKTYGDLYRAFVAALRPSADAIERVYSSRLVEHFYSSEEIARFREFWSVRDDPGRASTSFRP